jgi:hypothetical protein
MDVIYYLTDIRHRNNVIIGKDQYLLHIRIAYDISATEIDSCQSKLFFELMRERSEHEQSCP